MHASRHIPHAQRAARPQEARALLLQAREQMARQAWPQAQKTLERVTGQLDRVADIWLALAEVRLHQGDTRGCVAAAQRTLALEPDSQLACLLAATGLMRLQRLPEALAVFEAFPPEALAQNPELLVPYGEALHRSGRAQEAVNTLMQSLSQKIDDARAHCQLGFAFRALRLDSEAAECFRTVVALNPRSLPGHAYMAHWEQFSARWQRFDDNVAGLVAAIHHAADATDVSPEYSAPFVLLGLPHHPNDMLQAARLSARFLAQGVTPLPPRRLPKNAATRRIRVGYLSSDFHTHATALLLVEVLEQRDRERFEVVLFSHGRNDASPLRRRVEAACDRFVDVTQMTQGDTARAIREHDIDILVDLKGHTADTRLAALAFRPAPVQVSWLGFPGTTGAEWVDYFIGDPVATPLEHAPWYSEKLAQMPVCYQPNDSQRPRPGVVRRSDHGLPDDALVLASFNQPYKITPAVFDVWMDILKRLPQAVIWQLDGGEQARENLRAEARRRGVDAARLIFAATVSPDQHLLRLPAADLALDTWPCNGHTTTSDALWAGVPLVAMLGETFAARVAASLLHAVGTPELVCADTAAYVGRVVALAQDAPARAALRRRLAAARDQAPLFDAARFARDLEALYARMWARHGAGLAPAALEAQAA